MRYNENEYSRNQSWVKLSKRLIINEVVFWILEYENYANNMAWDKKHWRILMEWGIVRGNDPYLYGEKVKAYLRRGAKKVPGFDEYPNEAVGYGRLCLESSLPSV